MKVTEFLTRLSGRLHDRSRRYYTQTIITEALNSALAALCTTIPDAYTVQRDQTLVEGVEQRIDSDLHSLIRLLHNVCPTTGQAKRAITQMDTGLFDRSHPHWRQDLPRNHIRHYQIDDIYTDRFVVWPPAPPERAATAPVVPVEPVLPVDPGVGASQAEIDAYQLALSQYQASFIVYQKALIALAEYEAAPTSLVVRGHYTATPVIETEDPAIPGTAPVEPIDPGPVNTGLPEGVEQYQYATVLTPDVNEAINEGANYAETGNRASLTANPNVITDTENDIVILDVATLVAAYNASGKTNSATAAFFSSVHITGSIAINGQFEATTVAPSNRGTGNGTTPMEFLDFLWMVDNGFNYLPVSEFSGTQTRIAGNGMATLDDFPLYLRVIQPATSSQLFSAAERQLDDYVSTFSVDGALVDAVSINNGSRGTQVEYDMLSDLLGLGTYFYADFDISGLHSDPYLILFDNLGRQYTWDVTGNPIVNTNSNNAGTVFRWISGLRTYFVATQPEPNGARGELVCVDNSLNSTSPFAPAHNFFWPTAGIVTGVESRVTQATIDEYVANLLQYNLDLAAFQETQARYLAFLRGELFTLTSDIPVDDMYINALYEWCLYYCYALDGEETPNTARSNRHLTAFFQLLNKEENSDLLVDQSRRNDDS